MLTIAVKDLLIGCDSNARGTFFRSLEINETGNCLFDFIINTNSSVCNRGSTPTFHFLSSENLGGREEVLGITLLTDNEAFRVRNQRVHSFQSRFRCKVTNFSDPLGGSTGGSLASLSRKNLRDVNRFN